MGFAFATSTREVLEQVVREPRFRALTTIPLVAPMEVGLVAGAFALFGLSTWLYLDGRIPWLAMAVMNSFAVYASFTPLHDATHRTVSRNRRLNDLIGTISCLLLLPGITTRIYRYLHLEHHRYSGDAERDPDEPFVSAPAWALPFVLAGLDVLWSRWYIARFSTRPRSERIEFVCSIAFYVGFHVAWLLSPHALEFVLVWVIPQRLGLFYVAWFFAHVQHPKDVLWEEAPFQATVRIEANPWTRWFLLGQSKHHIHHLAPSLPYYRYHRAWDLGRHLFERQNIPSRTLWAPSKNLVLPGRETATTLSARIERVSEVAADIRSYELVPADGASWPRFEAGSHIDVHLPEGRTRQYSLCNSPDDRDRYVIAVRRDRAGRGGSEHVHAHLKPGDGIRIGAPRNNFPLREDFARFVLVAGGIGMTPLLSMARSLSAAGRPFELHVCARNQHALPFRDEIDEWAFAGDVHVHLDDGPQEQRFDAAALLGPAEAGAALYVCGPAGFMGGVIAEARSLGWSPDAIFSETFVPPKADAAENRSFEVRLARSGRTLSVAADESLLDVLNANGCAVICSCTQGICGSCMTPVLEGVPEHRDAVMTEAERAANDQMTVCVSRARSERLVLDL